MASVMLVTWRESLEAAIIIGILLTAVRRLGSRGPSPASGRGAGLGVIASLALGGIVKAYGFAWEGPAEKWMELGVFSVAAVLLTQMLVWMQRNKRVLRGRDRAAGGGGPDAGGLGRRGGDRLPGSTPRGGRDGFVPLEHRSSTDGDSEPRVHARGGRRRDRSCGGACVALLRRDFPPACRLVFPGLDGPARYVDCGACLKRRSRGGRTRSCPGDRQAALEHFMASRPQEPSRDGRPDAHGLPGQPGIDGSSGLRRGAHGGESPGAQGRKIIRAQLNRAVRRNPPPWGGDYGARMQISKSTLEVEEFPPFKAGFFNEFFPVRRHRPARRPEVPLARAWCLRVRCPRGS